MKTRIVLCLIGLVTIGLVLSSCSAEDGEIGPAGPAGPPGPAGPQGGQGETGTANVMYSEWFTVTQADWNGIGGTMITYNHPAEEITTEIEANGLVLVYHRFGAVARQLPYLYDSSGLHIGFTFVPDMITIEAFNLDGAVIPTIANVEFRYVIVPGGIPLDGKSFVDFKKMTYYQLMDYFGLNY